MVARFSLSCFHKEVLLFSCCLGCWLSTNHYCVHSNSVTLPTMSNQSVGTLFSVILVFSLLIAFILCSGGLSVDASRLFRVRKTCCKMLASRGKNLPLPPTTSYLMFKLSYFCIYFIVILNIPVFKLFDVFCVCRVCRARGAHQYDHRGVQIQLWRRGW